MSAVDDRQAFVTLAIRDSYGLGCVVLGHSIRNLNTNRELIVLVTDDVSERVRNLLSRVFDEVITVPILDGSDPRIGRPDLSISLTKLECWNLVQYEKCVFLDCDTLILRNCDELFELDEFSASPDIGWPDCFNTGVFVFKPSKETYNKLVNLAREKGSFDGGEHGLLNSFFGRDWRADLRKRLSYVYNMVSGNIYTYAPAFKRFGDLSKIAHFGGHPKPWLANWHRDGDAICPEYPEPTIHHPFLHQWLDIFWKYVYPQLPSVSNDLTETGDTFTVWSLLTAIQSPKVYLMSRKVKKIVKCEPSLFLPAYYSSPAPHPSAFYLPPSLHAPPIYYTPPPPPIPPPPPSPPPTYYAPPPYVPPSPPYYYEPPPYTERSLPPPSPPLCRTCFMPPPPAALVNVFFMPRTPPPSKFFSPPPKPKPPPAPPQQVFYEPQVPVHVYRQPTPKPPPPTPPPSPPTQPSIRYTSSYYKLITTPSSVQPPSTPQLLPAPRERRSTLPSKQFPTPSPAQKQPISPLMMLQRSPYRRSPFLPYYPALPPLTPPGGELERGPSIDLSKLPPAALAKEKGKIRARLEDRDLRPSISPTALAKIEPRGRRDKSVTSILSTSDPTAKDILSTRPGGVKFMSHAPSRGQRSLRVQPLGSQTDQTQSIVTTPSRSEDQISETSILTRFDDEHWGAEASRLEMLSEEPPLPEQKPELTFAAPETTPAPFSLAEADKRGFYEEPKGKIPSSRRMALARGQKVPAITLVPLDKTVTDMLGGLKTPKHPRHSLLQPFTPPPSPELTRTPTPRPSISSSPAKISFQPKLEKIPSLPSTSGLTSPEKFDDESEDLSTLQKPPPVVEVPQERVKTPPFIVPKPPPPTPIRMSMEHRLPEASIPVSTPDLVQDYRPSRHTVITPTPSYSEQIQIESRSLSASPVRPAGCCSPSHSVSSVGRVSPVMSARFIKKQEASRSDDDDEEETRRLMMSLPENHFRPIEAVPSTSTTPSDDVIVVPEKPLRTPLGVKTESERKGKKPKSYVVAKLPESKTSSGGLISVEKMKSAGRRIAASSRDHMSGVDLLEEDNLRDRERMKEWEEGKMDYLGKDKFENIQKKLDAFMAGPSRPSRFATDDDDEEELDTWRVEKPSVSPVSAASSELEEISEEFVTVESLGSDEEASQISSTGIPGYEVGDYSGMRNWEQGKIDIPGRDNSDNIMKRLDFLINNPSNELVNQLKSK